MRESPLSSRSAKVSRAERAQGNTATESGHGRATSHVRNGSRQSDFGNEIHIGGMAHAASPRMSHQRGDSIPYFASLVPWRSFRQYLSGKFRGKAKGQLC